MATPSRKERTAAKLRGKFAQKPTRLLDRVGLSGMSRNSPRWQPCEFSAAGMTVRHTPVSVARSLSYQWVGDAHYIALHDMRSVEGEVRVEDEPVIRRRDLRDTLTFVPAGCRIWGWGRYLAERQSFTALYLDPEQMREELADKLRRVPSRAQVYFSNVALQSTFEKLRASLTGTVPYEPLYIESLCLTAMLELSIVQHENLQVMAHPAGRLTGLQEARIRDYVEANLHLDISLNDLASIAKLSRFHFLRVFESTTHETPHRYLVRRRIERAQELLNSTHGSIATIGAAVGYKDSAAFSRAFSRVIGMTPIKFRSR